MRIAFFGGAFDPPHRGHLELAQLVLDSGVTDLVLFAPAYAPPHKDRRQIAAFADRMNMLHLALAGRPGMAVSDIEAELAQSPSYTFNVLAALEKRHPGDRIQLLIGGDSLEQFHTWYRAEELARRWEVLTYPRRGAAVDAAGLATHLPPELARQLARQVVAGDFLEISSTEIRKRMANGEMPTDIMPEQVADYMMEHAIYRNQGDKNV